MRASQKLKRDLWRLMSGQRLSEPWERKWEAVRVGRGLVRLTCTEPSDLEALWFGHDSRGRVVRRFAVLKGGKRE